jgi:hypothetical protein
MLESCDVGTETVVVCGLGFAPLTAWGLGFAPLTAAEAAGTEIAEAPTVRMIARANSDF